MTPQERRLVEDLFDRLATLETQPRERDAEQAIMAGLRRAPNATYALVQTVLLQEEALRRADERIRELEGGEAYQPQQGGGFLDSMRDAIFGGTPQQQQRGSVPQTGGDRPMGVPPGFRAGQDSPGAAPGQTPQQAEPGRGGSFLGTAAAAAVGVIGGSMLMNSIQGLLGGKSGQAQAAGDFGGGSQPSPWSDASSSDLAKQAGVDSIGQQGSGERSGLYGSDHPYDTAEAAHGDDYDLDMGDFDFE